MSFKYICYQINFQPCILHDFKYLPSWLNMFHSLINCDILYYQYILINIFKNYNQRSDHKTIIYILCVKVILNSSHACDSNHAYQSNMKGGAGGKQKFFPTSTF
jgi:hypothetical protein